MSCPKGPLCDMCSWLDIVYKLTQAGTFLILVSSPSSVQDHFARYPGHGLLATTHLLLKTGSGEKYNCALKWGIPALSDR